MPCVAPVQFYWTDKWIIVCGEYNPERWLRKEGYWLYDDVTFFGHAYGVLSEGQVDFLKNLS